jgi:hypothetical protein
MDVWGVKFPPFFPSHLEVRHFVHGPLPAADYIAGLTLLMAVDIVLDFGIDEYVTNFADFFEVDSASTTSTALDSIFFAFPIVNVDIIPYSH